MEDANIVAPSDYTLERYKLDETLKQQQISKFKQVMKALISESITAAQTLLHRNFGYGIINTMSCI